MAHGRAGHLGSRFKLGSPWVRARNGAGDAAKGKGAVVTKLPGPAPPQGGFDRSCSLSVSTWAVKRTAEIHTPDEHGSSTPDCLEAQGLFIFEETILSESMLQTGPLL